MDIYQNAIMAQAASNLGGLIHGWARAMTIIQEAARQSGQGTDWINHHPVNVLFAEQVYHLTGQGQDWAASYVTCERMAALPDVSKAG